MRGLELELWQRVAGIDQSVSHDFHHIRQVQAYAEELRRVYGGDQEVLLAACVLHDLGRGDEKRRHGLESIEASRELASAILQYVALEPEKKAKIIEAIETHDQPDLSPSLLEARILKDADFLAGFGAWGVLRIAMWSGETKRRVEDVMEKLSVGMWRRFESLEFEYSRAMARREILIARLFLAELRRGLPSGGPSRFPGTLIVVDGISGSGKNTIAMSVEEQLGESVVVVEEPTGVFRDVRGVLNEGGADTSSSRMMKAILMADRAAHVERTLIPALTEGRTVVSVRSYLSTAVYQGESDTDAYTILLDYLWVPRADLLVLLDVDAEEALKRIKKRAKAPGDFETREDLQVHRQRYLRYAPLFDARRFETVNASRSKKLVIREIVGAVRKVIENQAQ